MNNFVHFIRRLVIGYHHLWYISALLFALIVSYLLEKFKPIKTSKKLYAILTISLLAVGIFFDEYYKLFRNNKINSIATILDLFGGGRNFLFMALPIITIGRFISLNINKVLNTKPFIQIIFIILFTILSFLEVLFLFNKNGSTITCDITLFNWIPSVFLFITTFYWNPKSLNKSSRMLRKCVDIVYIVHVLFVYILYKSTNLMYLPRFFATLVLSFLTAIVIIICKQIINKKHLNQKL